MTDDATTSMPENSNRPPAGGTSGRRRRVIKLTDEQRQYVVRRLAADHRPKDIARDVQRRFGVAISRQAIEYYDPTRDRTAQKWSNQFVAARRSILVAQSGKPARLTRIEKLVTQTIEMVAERIFKGVDAEGRKMFAKRPEDISHNDRIRALVAFVRMLKATDPAGYAEIRSAFFDEHEQPAADVATPAGPAPAGEAQHAG
jgi:hypothetical protein